MSLIETQNFVKAGQLKVSSFWQMLWLTCFRGCSVANILHVPRRNFIGQVTSSKVWILDQKK